MSNPLLTQNPYLLITEISDIRLRQNFKNLDAYFRANNQMLGFAFFEYVFTKAQANVTLAHGLTTVPLDVIVTQCTGVGQVTFNYGLFDSKNVNMTSTGACRVRFFVGTYYNFTSSVQSNKTDAQTFGGGASSAAFKAPTYQIFKSGSGTYTPSTTNPPLWLEVEMVGGGGGAAGAYVSGSTNGANGTNTVFDGNMIAGFGLGSNVFPNDQALAGGVNSLPTTLAAGVTILVNLQGGSSGPGSNLSGSIAGAGMGGASYFGCQGGGGGYWPTNPAGTFQNGFSAAPNSGSGGGGAYGGSNAAATSGGSAGGYLRFAITTIKTSYSWSIGTGGAGGTGPASGGNGGSGFIIIKECYQ